MAKKKYRKIQEKFVTLKGQSSQNFIYLTSLI